MKQLHGGAAADGRKHVLIIDGDKDDRDLLTGLLEQASFRVRTAVDGDQALRAMAKQMPDIVIADWDIPGLDGRKLCRTIRDSTIASYVYILMTTQRSDSVDLVDALRRGADEYAPKPIVPREILARLEAAARFLDIERERRREAALDPQTGILNEATMHEVLEREHARSIRYDLNLSMILVEVSGLTQLRQSAGEAACDHLIRCIGKVLHDSSRPVDFAGSLNENELCLVLESTGLAGAESCAARLQEEIDALRDNCEFLSPPIALGTAQCQPDMFSPTDFIRAARESAGADRANPTTNASDLAAKR